MIAGGYVPRVMIKRTEINTFLYFYNVMIPARSDWTACFNTTAWEQYMKHNYYYWNNDLYNFSPIKFISSLECTNKCSLPNAGILEQK